MQVMLMPPPNPNVMLAQVDPNAARDALDQAFSLVQALPIEAHATMGLMLVMGLALWLFGGKLVKPLFAILGMALGGMIGLIVLPAVGLEEVGGAPGSLVGMGIGAVIGLVMSLVLLKVAIIFAAGLGFAVAGFLGGTIYLEHNPLPDDQPPAITIEHDMSRDPTGRLLFNNPITGQPMTIEELTRTLNEADTVLNGASGDEPDADGKSARERFTAIALQCRAVLAEAFDATKNHWNALSVRARLVVLGSTLGSMAMGMLVGFVLPKRATAGITALAGSAIWLTAGAWLIDALVPSWSGVTDQPPETWAVVWGIVFLVGLVVQLSGLGKGGGKKKAGKRDDAEVDDGEDEDEE